MAEERENKNLTKKQVPSGGVRCGTRPVSSALPSSAMEASAAQGFEEEETKQGPSAARLKFAPKETQEDLHSPFFDSGSSRGPSEHVAGSGYFRVSVPTLAGQGQAKRKQSKGPKG